MQSLTELMTDLSLNPFEVVCIADRASATLDGHHWPVAELKAAAESAPPDGSEGTWTSCHTCSDPGSDEDADADD